MSRKIWIRIVVIEFVALVGVLIFLLSIDKYEAVFELQSNGGVYDATEEAIYIDETVE